ncbi:hypothetical protein B6N60_02444 [Richelia sinica FACHB-800]|uniref:Uncharacterized protein n=1 Tax=Richelia sinica FACHB-800 TaxID=1357546 RepID=A0A975T966_9NOST|nr:hypothetical protein [Richelia sinica FACHB-800]QXE23753.1 hypothetical protein B6N60_02444 [Richelia sinica FACHB-800]
MNIKSLLFSVGLSSLLLSIGELPSNAQSFGGSSSSSSGGSSSSSSGSSFFTSPSLGTAGFVSGGGTTTSSGGVFSLPGFNSFPVFGIPANLIITPTTPGTTPNLSVTPEIATSVNNVGRNIIVSISTSGLAQLLASSPTLCTALNTTTVACQGQIASANNTVSFNNLREALRNLNSEIDNNQNIILTIGDVTVTLQ